ANSTSDHCRPQSSEARRPCRKAIRSIVLSRWPQRLPLAAWISFSTSRSVRCSRGRSSLLGRRVGVTVRFTVAGETSLRRVFAIRFKPPGRSTFRILIRIRIVVNGGIVAPWQNGDRRRPLNGLRATELVDLRWEQVDLKGSVPTRP